MNKFEIFLKLSFPLLVSLSCTNRQAEPVFFGQVEMQEFDVASRLSARVYQVSVKLGEDVKAGDLLAVMDDDVIAAKRNQAQAGIEAAESQKKIAEHAVREEELLQLKAAMNAAQKQMEYADTSLKRMKTLLAEGAIAQQQFDETEMKAFSARAQFQAAKAKYEMGMKGARDEQIDAAKALLSKAQSGLEEVEAFQKDLQIHAQVPGEVVQIYARPGELVPQGYPIMTLLKKDETWFSFYVREDHLGKFKKGQVYELEVPALNDVKMKAQLQYLSPLPAVATHVVTRDRGTFDLKTFELRLIPLEFKSEDLRPGMSVVLHAPRT